jgi:hypothetical protein
MYSRLLLPNWRASGDRESKIQSRPANVGPIECAVTSTVACASVGFFLVQRWGALIRGADQPAAASRQAWTARSTYWLASCSTIWIRVRRATIRIRASMTRAQIIPVRQMRSHRGLTHGDRVSVRWIARRNVAERDSVGAPVIRRVIAGITVSCSFLGARRGRIVGRVFSSASDRKYRQSNNEECTLLQSTHFG